MIRQTTIQKIPFLIFTPVEIKKIGIRFNSFGVFLSAFRPSLKKELVILGLDVELTHYMAASFFSAVVYGLLFFAFSFLLLALRGVSDTFVLLKLAAAVALLFTTLFFLLHLIYPTIIVKKIAAQEDKDLLYALREIMTEIEGGVPLFDSMKEVANGEYGVISLDFAYVISKVEGGMPMKEALRELAITTESEFLRRALWQMVTAMETGASMSSALPNVVDALENNLLSGIRHYSSNLTFLMLLYMLVAASVPSLGITFLVLLSAFGGIEVSTSTIGMLILFSIFGQLAMIGYMRNTRPTIFGG